MAKQVRIALHSPELRKVKPAQWTHTDGAETERTMPNSKDTLEVDSLGLATDDADLILETDEGFAPPPDLLPRPRRVPTRVVGRLKTEHGTIDVETRNVSRTGALVATHGEEFAIGHIVQLVLEDDLCDSVLVVTGRVARQVKASGAMVAIAIEFQDADVRRDEIVKFFYEAYKKDASWQKRAVKGPVEDFGIDGLIRMFAAFSSGGTLRFFELSEEATVVVAKNQVRGVKLGRVGGEKALARILSWKNATFEFEARADPSVKEPPVDVDKILATAGDEVQRLCQLDVADLPLDQEIVVDAFEVEVARRHFSRTEESIALLAATKLTIRKILDIIPEADSRIYPAILSLRHRKVLRNVGPKD